MARQQQQQQQQQLLLPQPPRTGPLLVHEPPPPPLKVLCFTPFRAEGGGGGGRGVAQAVAYAPSHCTDLRLRALALGRCGSGSGSDCGHGGGGFCGDLLPPPRDDRDEEKEDQDDRHSRMLRACLSSYLAAADNCDKFFAQSALPSQSSDPSSFGFYVEFPEATAVAPTQPRLRARSFTLLPPPFPPPPGSVAAPLHPPNDATIADANIGDETAVADADAAAAAHAFPPPPSSAPQSSFHQGSKPLLSDAAVHAGSALSKWGVITVPVAKSSPADGLALHDQIAVAATAAAAPSVLATVRITPADLAASVGPQQAYIDNRLPSPGVFLAADPVLGLYLNDGLFQFVLGLLTAAVGILVSVALSAAAYASNDLVLSNVEPGLGSLWASWTATRASASASEASRAARRSLVVSTTVAGAAVLGWAFVAVPLISGNMPRAVGSRNATQAATKAYANVEAVTVAGANLDQWVSAVDLLLRLKANATLAEPPASAVNFTYLDPAATAVNLSLTADGFSVAWGAGSTVGVKANWGNLVVANWTDAMSCPKDVFCMTTDLATIGQFPYVGNGLKAFPQLLLNPIDSATGVESAKQLVVGGQRTYTQQASDLVNIQVVKLQNYTDGSYVVVEFRFTDFMRSVDFVDVFNASQYRTLVGMLGLDYYPLTFFSGDNTTQWDNLRNVTFMRAWKDQRGIEGVGAAAAATDELCLGTFYAVKRDGDYYQFMHCLRLSMRVLMSGIDSGSAGACNADALAVINTKGGNGTAAARYTVNWRYIDDAAPTCYASQPLDSDSPSLALSPRQLASLHLENAPADATAIDAISVTVPLRGDGLDRAAALRTDFARALTPLAFLSKVGGGGKSVGGGGGPREAVTAVVQVNVVRVPWVAVAVAAAAVVCVLAAKLATMFVLPRAFQEPWYVAVIRGVEAEAAADVAAAAAAAAAGEKKGLLAGEGPWETAGSGNGGDNVGYKKVTAGGHGLVLVGGSRLVVAERAAAAAAASRGVGGSGGGGEWRALR